MAKRYQDPALTALLVAQVLLVFAAEPLAFEGFELPLITLAIIVVALILLLVLGSEVDGLDPEVMNICDDIVEIPQFGSKESLNVSVAAGVALYALRRATTDRS